jgi:predicted PurR-regulated permease PerM
VGLDRPFIAAANESLTCEKMAAGDEMKARPVIPHDQIEVKPAREEPKAERYGVLSGSVLVMAVLAVTYTLYFGREILLPLALATVLKLLLQPAMRLLQERLRFPGPLAALLLIIAVFGAIAAIGFTISVPAAGWIAKAPQSLPLLKEKFSILASPSIISSIGSTSWRT